MFLLLFTNVELSFFAALAGPASDRNPYPRLPGFVVLTGSAADENFGLLENSLDGCFSFPWYARILGTVMEVSLWATTLSPARFT